VEKFRKSLRGTIISTAGFSVRISGRTQVRYEDRFGVLLVDAEAMAVPGIHVVIYSRSIPDEEFRPRKQVIDNVARAFSSAGWTLEVE